MTRAEAKTGRAEAPRRVVLVLQGGGALGAYQAGVQQALAEAGLTPDWIAGVSIGAINAALVAGNAPERQIERLREFWNTVTAPSALWPDLPSEAWRAGVRKLSAASAVLFGQPGFFRPRPPIAWLAQPGPVSFYDTRELHGTLERLVDFDRVNAPSGARLSIGAVQVETGNLVYFDSTQQRIGAQHVMASGALPPGLATVEIEGRAYWDGGLVSNTPLQYVMDHEPAAPLLVFQVDLFPARGRLPTTLDEVAEREKDIRFSSRTRAGTTSARLKHEQGRLAAFLDRLPVELRDDPVARRLRAQAFPAPVDIAHLIYRPAEPQGAAKDYEFSRATMERRWAQGLADARATLAAAPWQVPRGVGDGVRVFDVLKK